MEKDKEILDVLRGRPVRISSGLGSESRRSRRSRGKDPISDFFGGGTNVLSTDNLEPKRSRRSRKKDPMSDLFGRGTDVFGAGKQFDPFK